MSKWALTSMERYLLRDIAETPEYSYAGFTLGPNFWHFNPASGRSRDKAIASLRARGLLEQLCLEDGVNILRATNLAVRKYKLKRAALAPPPPRDVKMWRTRAARQQEEPVNA